MLAGFATLVGISAFCESATAGAAEHRQWQSVTFDGVTVRVPAAWPVIRFARHPRACPRLDVHAVYVGTPGPDPACPAGLVGKTDAVMVGPMAARPAARTGARARDAGASAAVVAGQPADRTITEDLPAAGVQVSISYRQGRGLADTIRSSIRVAGKPTHAVRRARTRERATGAQARAGAAAQAGGQAGGRAGGQAGGQGIFRGAGFDACAAPSTGTMTKWLSSKYRAVGIYIGGANRACAQANLTPAWITGILHQGWRYFTIYPGLQSSCVQAAGDAVITTSKAAAQGTAAADDAASQAAGLGIPKGTPLNFDMEAYGPACDSQVTTFLSAWDAELHARGYLAGVYESFTNVGALVRASGSITEPDVIYYADWDGKATTTSAYMPAAMWTTHQRIHQYRGGHVETYGGASINLDNDQLDVNLGGSGTVPAPSHVGYRIAVAVNSNGTAEWFARSALSAVAHAWQQPPGALTWSAVHAVGESPTGIVSNPAAVAQADGRLTLFARNAAGRIEHGWQQAGFPNDWEWAKPLARPPLKAKAGTDPAAVLTPGRTVALYQTSKGGNVVTIRQRRANGNFRWTAWQNIGGSCAGTPAAIAAHGGGVDVYCITPTGDAAVNHWTGKAWSGWVTLAGGPGGLRGVPAVVTDGSGQTELFAATKAGGLADAWLAGGNGSGGTWTWGSPLAGAGATSGLTQKIAGSPAAATWPAGSVIVYARLADGTIGYIRHAGNAGSASWSGWASISAPPGGKAVGSPAGWLNATGAAGVAVLDGKRKLAVASNSGDGWSGWTEVGGGL
jgi:Domain of unknown function (DUF1906)